MEKLALDYPVHKEEFSMDYQQNNNLQMILSQIERSRRRRRECEDAFKQNDQRIFFHI